MTATTRTYLPAAGRDLFLPLYDPVTRLLGMQRLRKALIDRAGVRAGQRLLDLGCGTGSLLVMLKRHHPGVDAVGIDPDPRALYRAARKLDKAGASVQLDQGYADDLPYDDASFDRVVSSMVLHHLEPSDKVRALREVRRVLSPGGIFEMIDFGGRHDARPGLLHRLFHAHRRLADSDADHVLSLMTAAGLEAPQVVARPHALFGTLVQYEATRADATR